MKKFILRKDLYPERQYLALSDKYTPSNQKNEE